MYSIRIVEREWDEKIALCYHKKDCKTSRNVSGKLKHCFDFMKPIQIRQLPNAGSFDVHMPINKIMVQHVQ